MKKVTKMAYVYNAKCFNCNSSKKVYYTVADFGDAPIIMKCNYCGALYWYTLDDEAYIQPIDKQLNGKKCEKCSAQLLYVLVPTYTNIQCCGTEFNLDDNFASHTIQPTAEMEQLEVYLIYS